MTSRSHTLAVFALLLVLPFTAQAQKIQETADGFTATINKTFSVEPGGTLDLEATNGSITVSGGDRTQVIVKETLRFRKGSREDVNEYLSDYPTKYTNANGTVRIRGPEKSGGDWWGTSRNDVQYSYEVQVPRQFGTSLNTSGGSLTVQNLEGTVKGQTAGGSVTAEGITGSVRVRTAGGSLTLADLDGPVEGETAGGSIEATNVTGPLNVRTAGGSIRIAEVDDTVMAKTAGGSIRVEQVEGSVDARTSGGDVIVRTVSKAVDARTSGGDIELEDLDGRVTAKTSGGDIEGRRLRGAVRATTAAGDVDLREITAAVRARTSVGDVEVEITSTDVSADPAVDLKTSHGDIHLTLPAAFQASIRAEVEGYGAPGMDDEIRSDVPLTREGGDGEPLRATGAMNGGGPAIELETSGGSIRIRTTGNGS